MLNIEQDRFYQLLQNFLAGEPTDAPFVVQTFFDLIRGTSQASGNALLFFKALRNDLEGLFRDMQRAGLYGELFVLSFYLGKEMGELGFVQKSAEDVELQLLRDIINGELATSQRDVLAPARCFSSFVRSIKDLLLDVNPDLFQVQRMGAVFDVLAAQIQFYQIEARGHMRLEQPEQLYLLAEFFEVSGRAKEALEILRELSDVSVFPERQEQMLRCSERLALGMLFAPADVFWLQERVLELEPTTEAGLTRQIFIRDLLDLVRVYHSKGDIKSALEQLQLTGQLGEIVEEHGTVLGRFLILAATRVGVLERIAPLVARFQLDEETKRAITAGM